MVVSRDEETGASIPPDDSSLPKTQAAGISHEGCMIVRSNDARYLATLVVAAFNMASWRKPISLTSDSLRLLCARDQILSVEAKRSSIILRDPSRCTFKSRFESLLQSEWSFCASKHKFSFHRWILYIRCRQLLKLLDFVYRSVVCAKTLCLSIAPPLRDKSCYE